MKIQLIMGLTIEIVDADHCHDRCPWIKLRRGFFGPKAECTIPARDGPFSLKIDGQHGALRMDECKESDSSKLMVVSKSDGKPRER